MERAIRQSLLPLSVMSFMKNRSASCISAATMSSVCSRAAASSGSTYPGRARRLRGPARCLQVPSARDRGLGALRPAGEARRLRRLRLPRRLRRRPRRATGWSRCTASTPNASSSPSTATTAPAFAEVRRRYQKREQADRRPVAAALPDRRRARRQLLPDPRRLRRPDRRARGRDLPATPTTSSCRRSSR